MDTSNIRILIVDDNPQVRQNLAAVLDLAGSNAGLHLEIVGQAVNGSEGVELSRTLQPDVVLMDLEMPVLDGFEATRQIKSCQPAPRVVVLSAHSGEEQRARAAGADGFIVKGASYQIMLNTILGKDGSPNSFEKGEK